MEIKNIIRRLVRAFRYKVLGIEKPPTRANIWAAIDYSGWNSYEAYCNLLKMKKNGIIKEYSEVSRRTVNTYKKTQVKKMLQGEPELQINKKRSEEDFYKWFFTERQKKAIIELQNGRFTNGVLSDFLMIELPEEAGDSDKDILNLIRTIRSGAKSGSVFLWFEGAIPTPERMKLCNPLYAICSPRYKSVLTEAEFPYVFKKNLSGYVFEMSRIWRKALNTKTVEISGTVGKTTTTEMIKSVVGSNFSMYAITGNKNTSCQEAGFVYNLKPEHEVYVQESAGSNPGQLERSSKVIEPDIFVITNIGHGHIGNFGGSREFLLHEKLAMERHAKENAIGIVNMDDKLLCASSYSHEIKWISLKNEQADFFAKDISTKDGKTEFSVVERDGTETAIVLDALGLHNVYNALSAFAVGVILKIEREAIAKSLKGFKNSNVRQHYAEYGGRRWYFDCYSITEESVASHVQVLSSFKLEDEGKRVLVLGDIIQPLGEQVEEIHRRLGDIIADKSEIDEVFLYGKAVKYTFESLKKNGIRCRYTDNRDDIRDWILNDTGKKDIVGFKANHFSKFEWIIDDLCGTDYYFVDDETLYDLKMTHDGIVYKINEEYGTGVFYAQKQSVFLSIPETICGTKVRIIGRVSFAGKKTMKKIMLPDNLECISERAFSNCKSLKEISFGKGLRYIGEQAFEGCSSIEIIDLSDTCIGAIERDAFSGCNSLKKVILPKTSKWISEKAFDKSVEIVEID